MTHIYGLIDPRDKLIHYIGSAQDAFARFGEHIKSIGDTRKELWIAELKALGLQPELIILATVADEDRFKEEYRWIYLGRISGWPLTNTSAMVTGRYIELADCVSGSVQDIVDDRSAVYHDRQSLLDILRCNQYMPTMVDGDLVQLVRSGCDDSHNVATLGIVRMTDKGRRYINCRGWTVPLNELNESATALLDDYRNLYGEVCK